VALREVTRYGLSNTEILHLTGLALTFMGLSGILAMEITGEAPFSKPF
jgi:hypothetical protein